MKTFFTGFAFVLMCAMFAGLFTGIIMAVAEDGDACNDARAALTAYTVENQLTIRALERLSGFISQ